MAALDELDELVDDHLGGAHRLGGTVEGDHVPAEVEVTLHLGLERSEHRVAGPAQGLGDHVGHLDLPSHVWSSSFAMD